MIHHLLWNEDIRHYRFAIDVSARELALRLK